MVKIYRDRLNEFDDVVNIMVDVFKVYRKDNFEDVVWCLGVVIDWYM